jgi:hypothetical protein
MTRSSCRTRIFHFRYSALIRDSVNPRWMQFAGCQHSRKLDNTDEEACDWHSTAVSTSGKCVLQGKHCKALQSYFSDKGWGGGSRRFQEMVRLSTFSSVLFYIRTSGLIKRVPVCDRSLAWWRQLIWGATEGHLPSSTAPLASDPLSDCSHLWRSQTRKMTLL